MSDVQQTENQEQLINYDIISYKINVVDKKILDRKNKWENILHMAAGHTSEISDELITALQKNDKEGVIAELGDATFFCVGTMIFMDLWKEKNFTEIINSDHYLVNLGFNWNEEQPEDFPFQAHVQTLINLLQIQNGKINTVIKNLLNKDKALYEGVVLTEEEIVKLFTAQLANLNTLAYLLGFGFAMVRKTNAIKLGFRYKDNFTVAESMNRDIEGENQAMAQSLADQAPKGVEDAKIVPMTETK